MPNLSISRKCTVVLLLTLISLSFSLWSSNHRVLLAAADTNDSGATIYLPLLSSGSQPQPQNEPPKISFFQADPSTINVGESTTLSWNVTNATKVSIEGLGDVSGTTIVVKPTTTTTYTMIAANEEASQVAQVTVTVATNGGSATANFFLPYDLYDHLWSNRKPQLVVDGQGVTHVAYVSTDSAAVFYGYCTTNCTSKESFTMGGFGMTKVGSAELAVDAAGHPRLLLGVDVDGVYNYRYAVCDSDCTTPEQWYISDNLVESNAPGRDVEASRPFVLDAQGHPRFVHSTWNVNGTNETYFVYCDDGCTEPGNWQQVTILDSYVQNLSLQLTPSGLARIGYYEQPTDQQSNVLYRIGYLECTTLDCSGRSGPLIVAPVSSGATVFGLRLDSQGHSRIVLYPGNGVGGPLAPGRIYLLSCDTGCTQNLANWWVLDIGLPSTVNGESVYPGELGLDMIFDSQDHPRMAFRISPFGELGIAWCNQSDCVTSSTGWKYDLIPATQAADQELGHIRHSCPTCNPPVMDCVSSWDAGWWPALAVNPNGDTLLAFEAQLWSQSQDASSICHSQALARFSRLAVYPSR